VELKKVERFGLQVAQASLDKAAQVLPVITTGNVWVESPSRLGRDDKLLAARLAHLRDQLLSLEEQYDYIMIDTPPSLGVLTINALVAATRVIIPTEARYFSLQGLKMLEDSIEEILYVNPRLEVLGILLSKMDRRLKEERQVAEYVRKNWGVAVFATEVGTNSKILEAGSVGVSVFHYVGAEKAMDTYLSLADEVISRA